MLGRLYGLVVLLLLADAGLAAEKLYRYKDTQGRVVINHTLPPEVVEKGYEVLSSAGYVLQVVPRTLTAEEIESLSKEEKIRRQKERESEAQLHYDESLLLRYSDVVDIEAARDRTLKEFKIRISILKGNQFAVKRKVEAEQARAADIERNGQAVPKIMLDNIQAMQDELEITQKKVILREYELEQVQEQYEADIKRFKELREQLDTRR